MSSTFVSAANSTPARVSPRRSARGLHLIDRLFAGDIDDPAVLRGERAADLDEQRRLANSRFAGEEQHRARHETAAQHPVEFADAGGEARRRKRRGAEVEKGEDAAFARASRWHADRLLDERIPRPTGIAAPLPARRHRTAALADEGDP